MSIFKQQFIIHPLRTWRTWESFVLIWPMRPPLILLSTPMDCLSVIFSLTVLWALCQVKNFFYFFFLLFYLLLISDLSLPHLHWSWNIFHFHCCTTFSGWNLLRASGRFVAQGPDADILIQKFLAGESNVLRAVAPSVDASSDPLFSQFVGGLSLDTTLHGEKTGLIKQGVMLL